MNLTYLICISIFNVGILGVYGFTRSTIRSLEMKSNVPITHAHHQWYVVAENDKIEKNVPTKIVLNNVPITIWKNNDNSYAAVHDICPHRGVSLSRGRVDTKTGCVVCPYHTFKYNSCGRMVQSPGQKNLRTSTTFSHKTDIVYYRIKEVNNWVYLYDKPLYDVFESPPLHDVWFEPEAFDQDYRYITLSKDFNVDARTVTENSLDILHISELHNFGNPRDPLPKSDKTEKVGEEHTRVSYKYKAGPTSIPKLVYNIEELIIENEYVLPHYTVARVKFGDFINTIVTSAMPISDDKTKLFVKTYRNNLITHIPIIDTLFDGVMYYLMDKTLNEDKGVIEHIYPSHRDGKFITKYDELIRSYRNDYSTYVDKDRFS